MKDSELRVVKERALRAAAESLTAAEAGEYPAQNRILAAMLLKRADRVAAGENDYSRVLPSPAAPEG